MKASTATALRANLVLYSVSTAIAIVPCVSLASLLGLLDDGAPTLPYLGSIFSARRPDHAGAALERTASVRCCEASG